MESILESIFVNQYTFLHMSLSIFCWILLPIFAVFAVIGIIYGVYYFVCYFMDDPFPALGLIGIGVGCGLFAWFMIDAGLNNYAKSLIETADSLFRIVKSI